MRVLVLVLLAAASPLLAGCFSNPLPTTSASTTAAPAASLTWYEKALAEDAGHDHSDPAQHQNMSTPNFLLLGHDSLISRDSGGRLVGSWGCGEAGEAANGRRLAILDGFGTDEHAIADVTDPAHPFKAGDIKVSGVSAWDDALTPDGRYAIIGVNSLARIPTLKLTEDRAGVTFVDSCAHESTTPIPDDAAVNGVMIFDITDPAHPIMSDYFPLPSFNLHSVSTAIIDGTTYVTASVVDLDHPTSTFHFFEILDTPLGGKLVHLSDFAPPAIALAQGLHAYVPLWNGHNDATLQKSPANGKLYAYLAAWDGGLITLDMTVPEAPVMVSQWDPVTSGQPSDTVLTGDCYPFAIHTTFPFPELWNGKHYLVAGQECPSHVQTGTPAGQLFILDNTDPANPTLAGRWNLPVDTGIWTTEYQASPHYVALVGKTLFCSMYHAGLWAIDLSGNLTSPPAIGVYVPDIRTGAEAQGGPFTEQINAMSNGDLVLNDDISGVYVLRFDPTSPAPAAYPFFHD